MDLDGEIRRKLERTPIRGMEFTYLRQRCERVTRVSEMPDIAAILREHCQWHDTKENKFYFGMDGYVEMKERNIRVVNYETLKPRPPP